MSPLRRHFLHEIIPEDLAPILYTLQISWWGTPSELRLVWGQIWQIDHPNLIGCQLGGGRDHAIDYSFLP